MYKLYLGLKSTLLCLYLIFSFSIAYGQNAATTTINLEKARILIDSLDQQFALHYFNGDSIALYNMYAKDARFENFKGTEILLYWGKQIRNSNKNDTRHLKFMTTSLSTDSEYLVELGIYEFQDNKGNSKYKGKYLVF